MTLDPEIAWVLGRAAKSGQPPLETLSPSEARKLYARNAAVLDLPPAPMAAIEERSVPGPAGPIPVRLYVPAETGIADPLLVFFHGGGWVIGSIDTHDRTCRALAAQAGCRVASVEYRLAPEHRFPAAIDDAFAAWRVIAGAAAEWGADGGRIAIGGDSAGGSLAATVCHLAQRASAPLPCLQVLIYPSADIRRDSASHARFAEGYLLTQSLREWFCGHYIAEASERADPRASPLAFGAFRGLPPAHLQTAGFDPIQDEGIAYAAALATAGVAVEHKHYPGLVHGYLQLAGYAKAARAAVGDAAAALSRAFRG
jgi:acetyl esterase